MNKLRSVGEWTPELLEEYYAEIEKIAVDELQLDTYPNQIEIITSGQMLDAYSTHAMPVMYNHWRFGKSYVTNKNMYDKGRMNLAFEVVINSSPCIAYFMEENSIMMQALVCSHACFGHNYFFKNNYLFKEWTDATAIVDYLLYAKNYISLCEEKHGSEQVEAFMDACHSLELYGVDRYKRKNKPSMERERVRLENAMLVEQAYDDVIAQTLPKTAEVFLNPELDLYKKFENMEPQENLLYFLEKNSPLLETWQRELLRIVRKVAQYFYPQMQTKLINEGTATTVHHYIMNRLYEKGLVDDGFMLEFYESHTGVIAQPGFDHPAYKYVGINVYALGFAMFQDIKRISMEPTEEDREYFPDWAGNGDWLANWKWAMENFRDESFISQFLSPKVIRDFRMFSIHDNPLDENVHITDIHNKEGYLNIRDNLANMFNLSEQIPDIQVYKVDAKTRKLHLRHTSDAKMNLDKKQTVEVVNYIKQIWKFDVVLNSMTTSGEVYDTITTEKEMLTLKGK